MSNPKFSTRKFEENHVARLVAQGTTPVMAKILASRGIADLEDNNLGLNRMLPISSLTNATKMASILADAIRDNKKIMIVADYDCDGATACTISYRAMKAFGANVDYLVPNRFEDGYGLTRDLVKKCAPKKPDYIFTVDNGISSVDGVAYANEIGIKVLVTDHHLPGDTLPAAECIVNPNQPGCTFPSKNLAGCGVAWYIMAALQKELQTRNGRAPDFNVRSLLDLVALGTIADVVKLDLNNRCLVSTGIRQMREGRTIPAIAALISIAGRKMEEISTFDMGFTLGPRINAIGRLEDMSIGINALIADDMESAQRGAKTMDKTNTERKQKENEAKEEAEKMADALEAEEGSDRYTMVFVGEDWHEGVVGIVASRIKERTNRPTFILTKGDHGDYKGSGRSIPTMNLRDCLDLVHKARPDILIKFGGHAMAAGLTVHADKVKDFQVEFEKAARRMLTPDMLEEVVETDGELKASEMTPELAKYIRDQIWGNGFPAPLFEGNFKVEGQQVVKEKHMRLALSQEGKSFTAMAFFRTEPFSDHAHIAYTLDVNEWNGTERLQLIANKTLDEPKPEIKIDKIDEIHKTSDGFCF